MQDISGKKISSFSDFLSYSFSYILSRKLLQLTVGRIAIKLMLFDVHLQKPLPNLTFRDTGIEQCHRSQKRSKRREREKQKVEKEANGLFLLPVKNLLGKSQETTRSHNESRKKEQFLVIFFFKLLLHYVTNDMCAEVIDQTSKRESLEHARGPEY